MTCHLIDRVHQPWCGPHPQSSHSHHAFGLPISCEGAPQFVFWMALKVVLLWHGSAGSNAAPLGEAIFDKLVEPLRFSNFSSWCHSQAQLRNWQICFAFFWFCTATFKRSMHLVIKLWWRDVMVKVAIYFAKRMVTKFRWMENVKRHRNGVCLSVPALCHYWNTMVIDNGMSSHIDIGAYVFTQNLCYSNVGLLVDILLLLVHNWSTTLAWLTHHVKTKCWIMMTCVIEESLDCVGGHEQFHREQRRAWRSHTCPG